MVIYEDTKDINVLEVSWLFLPPVTDNSHALFVGEGVSDWVVHGIVEEGGDVVLIVANIPGEAVEAFSHLEDSGGLTEFSPEVLGNLGDSVNTDTIQIIIWDEFLDPVQELLSNIGVFLFQIWEAWESAVLNLPLITPVVDIAVIMVVLGLIKGGYLGVVEANWTNMVGYHIYHHPDIHIVGSLHELLQAVSTTKVIIDFIPILSPVTVEAIFGIINNWWNPNGIKTKIFNVLQVLNNTIKVTTAVVWLFAEIAVGLVAITLGESISYQLIHCSRFPCICVFSKSGSCREECAEDSEWCNFSHIYKIVKLYKN